MTTEPPTTPHVWEQNNTQGGKGFQGGEHHHYYSGDPVGDPVPAAAEAATTGAVIGSPITGWAPLELGVHTSITTTDTGRQEGLPRYVTRPHDQQLRDLLRGLVDRGESGLVVLVGDSCTGKTRTHYEAVTDPTVGLVDRPIYRPDTQAALADQLRLGLPGPVIMWLDELQRYVDHHHGAPIAAALHHLLTAPPDRVGGPILVLATMWTTTLQALTTEPRTDPSGAAAGAHQVRDLLQDYRLVRVGPDFTGAEPDQLRAAAATDPRIRRALKVAGDPARVTQVLAGGTSLLARLYPDDPDLQRAAVDAGPAFHPPARAIIYAAGELRRVGWDDTPIPEPLLRGVATGYLDSPHHKGWFDHGLAEATHDADADQRQALNIHTHGIPALTALETPDDGRPVYQLHDYLVQDHQSRHRHSPTCDALWQVVVRPESMAQISSPARQTLARSAALRGLTATSVALLDECDPHDVNQVALAEQLSLLGDEDALYERASRPESRGTPAEVGLLALRAESGDRLSLDRLIALAEEPSGWYAVHRLAEVLAQVNDDESLARLNFVQHSEFARHEYLRVLAGRGDDRSLQELRSLASPSHSGVSENAASWYLAIRLAKSGHPDSVAEIRRMLGWCELEPKDPHLLRALAVLGDEDSLQRLRRVRIHVDPGGASQFPLALADLGGEALKELVSLVHGGAIGAADALIHTYQRQNPKVRVTGLGVDGSPIIDPNRSPRAEDQVRLENRQYLWQSISGRGYH